MDLRAARYIQRNPAHVIGARQIAYRVADILGRLLALKPTRPRA
jgi:hypothetical protein